VVEMVVALAAGKLLSLTGILASAPLIAAHALEGVRESVQTQLTSSPLSAAAAVILLAMALATLWSEGVRGWFAPLRHGPRTT